jgi:hypothetical protein
MDVYMNLLSISAFSFLFLVFIFYAGQKVAGQVLFRGR